VAPSTWEYSSCGETLRAGKPAAQKAEGKNRVDWPVCVMVRIPLLPPGITKYVCVMEMKEIIQEGVGILTEVDRIYQDFFDKIEGLAEKYEHANCTNTIAVLKAKANCTEAEWKQIQYVSNAVENGGYNPMRMLPGMIERFHNEVKRGLEHGRI